MKYDKNYLKILKELEESLNGTPGVITVGLGKEEGSIVLVIFVDKKKLDKKNLPPNMFHNMSVVTKPSGQTELHVG